MSQKALILFLLLISNLGISQVKLDLSPTLEYFNYARYPLSNVGGDFFIKIGSHWTINYHIRLGMPNNNALYSHLGVSQALGGFFIRQTLQGESIAFAGIGLAIGWLPEGIGYQWHHKKFTSHLNVSMWGYENYNQRTPKDNWGFVSQTLQYRAIIPKSWGSIENFTPYISISLNDDNWAMQMPALAFRIGCGITIKKREKLKNKEEKFNPPVEDNFN
jgi:hypothetical protein